VVAEVGAAGSPARARGGAGARRPLGSGERGATPGNA
jgi:hypothetical protein